MLSSGDKGCGMGRWGIAVVSIAVLGFSKLITKPISADQESSKFCETLAISATGEESLFRLRESLYPHFKEEARELVQCESIYQNLRTRTGLVLTPLNGPNGPRFYDSDLLEEFTQLEVLNLDGQGVVDLKLLKALSIDGNQVSDLRALNNLRDLESLSAAQNQIRDVRPLQDLSKLTALNLTENGIQSLSEFSKLTALVEVALSKNEIQDISPLAGVPALESAWLDDNKIEDVSALGGAPKLSSIDLSGNPLRYQSLSGLTNITELAVSYAGVKHPEVFKKMNWLNKLFFRQDEDRIKFLKIKGSLMNTRVAIF